MTIQSRDPSLVFLLLRFLISGDFIWNDPKSTFWKWPPAFSSYMHAYYACARMHRQLQLLRETTTMSRHSVGFGLRARSMEHNASIIVLFVCSVMLKIVVSACVVERTWAAPSLRSKMVASMACQWIIYQFLSQCSDQYMITPMYCSGPMCITVPVEVYVPVP